MLLLVRPPVVRTRLPPSVSLDWYCCVTDKDECIGYPGRALQYPNASRCAGRKMNEQGCTAEREGIA